MCIPTTLIYLANYTSSNNSDCKRAQYQFHMLILLERCSHLCIVNERNQARHKRVIQMSHKQFSQTDYALAEVMNAEFDNDAFDAAHAASALASVTDTLVEVSAIEAYQNELIAAIDARAAYELAKNADNDSMQAKLKSFKASVSHARIVEILMSANVSANLINRNERVNARFNEKAFVKVVNIARALAKTESLNIYTRAILASVRSFEQNEMMLTERETKDACTTSSHLSSVNRNSALIRVAKHYDASTCSTQASSTNNALQAFNVIRETRDDANNVCFTLNHESATTQALLALL